MNINSILQKATEKDNASLLSREEMAFLLSLESKDDIRTLFDYAYKIKCRNVNNIVYLRGIIEFSNICTKDCFYCGIRKSNAKLKRYQMTKDEIINTARIAYENRYGSVLLQSGERTDRDFISFVEDVVRTIKKISNGKLGITLSLGEQKKETYQRWFDAGAHRYLLRIETSDRKLYEKIHPDSHSFDNRVQCLSYLRDCGYQVGTGVMAGLPGQTYEELADDIKFFCEQDIDMLGMGPFIPHNDTPMAVYKKEFDAEKQLYTGLKLIAVCRIVLQDINIAASTALHALHPDGQMLGVQAGANVIMPNITNTDYKKAYRLYNNKPCVDETPERIKHKLMSQIVTLGETIGWDEWGDSPRFFKTTIPVGDDTIVASGVSPWNERINEIKPPQGGDTKKNNKCLVNFCKNSQNGNAGCRPYYNGQNNVSVCRSARQRQMENIQMRREASGDKPRRHSYRHRYNSPASIYFQNSGKP